MEPDNKVSNDLYKSYGELFNTKPTMVSVENPTSTTMYSKLQNVRNLSTLDDTKIHKLLNALDDL